AAIGQEREWSRVMSSQQTQPPLSSARAIQKLSALEVFIFCITAGIFLLLALGYNYGVDDHLEQLPLLSRMMDSHYCTTVFFLNASNQFTPRTYYSWLLAGLDKRISVPRLFLALTLICSVMQALVPYGATKTLVQGSDAAAMIAIALVVATPGLTMGRPN